MLRRGSGRGRALAVGLITVAALCLAASPASAVTRYAAPGGTAADTVCVTPTAAPCSIGTAAAGTNVVAADEAVIMPGTYSNADLNGDQDSSPGDGTIQPKAASVHGQFGSPRPVINLTTAGATFGAFFVGPPATLSHLEIDSSTANTNVSTSTGGVIDGVVVRNDLASASVIACTTLGGTIRNSACLTTGASAVAVGVSVLTGGTTNVTLRGVTAVSTGGGSFGLNYGVFGSGAVYNVGVRNTIAKGQAFDVRARGVSQPPNTPGTGGSALITLDFSNYATESEVTDAGGGSATVTNPGAGGNETAAPMLAADGFHQLPSSASTINQGSLDGSSGTLDIDRQARQIGLAPTDIGADELGVSSATAISCTPSAVTLGGSTTCTATVSAAAEFINGTVDFTSSVPGSFSATSCNPSGNAPSAQCSVMFTPAQPVSHQITGIYRGGTNHDGSQGAASLAVSPAPQSSPANPPAKRRKCRKKKRKKGAAAAKKCKKKKKKG